MLVTAGAGTLSWTVTRGIEGTTAASHSSGASVYHTLTAAGLLRSPGALTSTGDVPYLASTGAPARLAAGANGTYLRYASGLPTASALLLADLPAGVGLTANPLSQFATTTSAQLAATLSDETGSGLAVFNNTPTLIAPVLGTPTSGVLTNCTGLPLASLTGLGTGVATWLGTPSSANLAAALTDETGSGALVFATSPTLVTPLLGTPTSGVLTNCTGLPLGSLTGLGTGVGTWLATPSSANLAAAITDETGSGALVFATSPTFVTPVLGTPSSGTLTSCTGLPISTGVSGLGTGVATFLATPSSANLLSALTTSTGTGSNVFATSPTLVTPVLGTPSSGTLTSCTGLPLTTGVTGTLPVANGGTGVTSSTGTVAVVLSTSPTLVTPLLGTPTSGTLTNCTGLPISSGVSGLGTGVATFLATPSSANLLSALTTSTGTGSNVFATSPTLVTPVLGVATATSIAPLYFTDANTLEQYNSTTGQTLNLYNTTSSANANYERLALTWSSNTLVIDTQKLGTGSARNISLRYGGSERLRISNTDVIFLQRLDWNSNSAINVGGFTMTDAKDIALGSTTGTKIGTATTQKLGFFNATPVVQTTRGGTLTNNVTSGGTTDQIDDFTSLTIYATDAAAIRNDIYQLARAVRQHDVALRALGLES